jgi:hypothetical protein
MERPPLLDHLQHGADNHVDLRTKGNDACLGRQEDLGDH